MTASIKRFNCGNSFNGTVAVCEAICGAVCVSVFRHSEWFLVSGKLV